MSDLSDAQALNRAFPVLEAMTRVGRTMQDNPYQAVQVWTVIRDHVDALIEGSTIMGSDLDESDKLAAIELLMDKVYPLTTSK